MEYHSEGGQCNVTRKELEKIILDSPLATQSIHQILPLLLYWGKKRNYIDNLFSKHPDETIEQFAQKVERTLPVLDALGLPYNIKVNEEIKQKILPNTGKTDRERGKNYRYPECCIENFVTANESKKMPTQFYEELMKQDKKDIRRKTELLYVMHIPCKASCEKTKKLGKEYQAFVQENFPRTARHIELREATTLVIAVQQIKKYLDEGQIN